MAQIHHATLRTKAQPSLPSSARSNAGPLHSRSAALRIPCQSKRRVALSIVCSNSGSTDTVTVEKQASSVPAGAILGRSSFPTDFAFGTASSAYQVEGAWNEGGRGPSIWDEFTHKQADKIAGRANGDIATDSYHRYKEDIKIMKQMGCDSYRFSISWSRILPDGTLKGGINKEGVKYYNNLINELKKNGITPYVTLFHWDLPQALEKKYGGFRDRKIVDDFKEFAKVCFEQFGDRVKHWITLNEPWTFSFMGYSHGKHAPGRCSSLFGCPAGDSLTEPYIVTHNLILAHAAAATLYKDHFQTQQKGVIGITHVSMWFKPYSESHEDKEAAQRSMDFMLGWFMDPLATGDYPFIMRAIVRDRLPYFTEEESKMIKGSYDFIGLNYYTSRFARTARMSKDHVSFLTVQEAYATQEFTDKNGNKLGDTHGDHWIHVVPDGLKSLLMYAKERYNNPNIYITENGNAQVDKNKMPVENARADKERIDYMSRHLAEVRAAIQDGASVKGYFAWALTDNFEWQEGYVERFGLTYVDYADKLTRYPKASSGWYTKFLKS